MSEKKKYKILWANRYCLADTSSGASMAVREMLQQLAAREFEVRVELPPEIRTLT